MRGLRDFPAPSRFPASDAIAEGAAGFGLTFFTGLGVTMVIPLRTGFLLPAEEAAGAGGFAGTAALAGALGAGFFAGAGFAAGLAGLAAGLAFVFAGF